MSQEELRRVEVLARVRSNQLGVVDASRLLGVSYRQAKRLWKRYREEGAASQLDRIFRLESERTIGNDWVVRYANHYFQLEPQSRHYVPARSKVLVWEGRYGVIGIEYRGRALGWKQIAAPLKPLPRAVGARVAVAFGKRKWVPPADHPWREPRRVTQQKELREVAPASLAWPYASS